MERTFILFSLVLLLLVCLANATTDRHTRASARIVQKHRIQLGQQRLALAQKKQFAFRNDTIDASSVKNGDNSVDSGDVVSDDTNVNDGGEECEDGQSSDCPLSGCSNSKTTEPGVYWVQPPAVNNVAKIEIVSEGCEDEGRTYGTCGIASIKVNDIERASDEGYGGFKIVVLDQFSGGVVSDVWFGVDDSEESDSTSTSSLGYSNAIAMNTFLEEIGAGHIVIIAVEDSAHSNIGIFRDQLEALGATSLPEQQYQSWAFVGCKDCPDSDWVQTVTNSPGQGPSTLSTTVSLEDTTPIQVYCDGRWALSMKLDSDSTFEYDSPYWSDGRTLNPESLNVNYTTGGAKLESYNRLPVSAVRVCVTDATTNCIEVELEEAKMSSVQVFAGEYIPGISFRRQSFYDVFSPSGMNDCSMVSPGFNVQCPNGNSARMGFCATEAGMPCADEDAETPQVDAIIGFGIEGSDCCAGGAGWTNGFVAELHSSSNGDDDDDDDDEDDDQANPTDGAFSLLARLMKSSEDPSNPSTNSSSSNESAVSTNTGNNAGENRLFRAYIWIADDVDECAINNGGCDVLVTCTNTKYSHECGQCPDGYTGDGYTVCTDINECETENGGCDILTTCTNTAGSRECGECPFGYGAGDGSIPCADIDECAEDHGGCDALASCTNKLNGEDPECGPCPSGYSGDGQSVGSCIDIDECSEGGGICHRLTECINEPGSYQCTPCPSGYEGTGETGCEDIDECSLGLDHTNGGCDPLTECINTRGSFECGPCPQGYFGTGKAGCEDINECELIGNGGCNTLVECINTPGSRECGECPDGYFGKGVGELGCLDGDKVYDDYKHITTQKQADLALEKLITQVSTRVAEATAYQVESRIIAHDKDLHQQESLRDTNNQLTDLSARVDDLSDGLDATQELRNDYIDATAQQIASDIGETASNIASQSVTEAAAFATQALEEENDLQTADPVLASHLQINHIVSDGNSPRKITYYEQEHGSEGDELLGTEPENLAEIKRDEKTEAQAEEELQAQIAGELGLSADNIPESMDSMDDLDEVGEDILENVAEDAIQEGQDDGIAQDKLGSLLQKLQHSAPTI